MAVTAILTRLASIKNKWKEQYLDDVIFVSNSATVIPRLHDTTGCQTGWTTCWTTGWCLLTQRSRLFNRFDNRLYRVNEVLEIREFLVQCFFGDFGAVGGVARSVFGSSRWTSIGESPACWALTVVWYDPEPQQHHVDILQPTRKTVFCVFCLCNFLRF